MHWLVIIVGVFVFALTVSNIARYMQISEKYRSSYGLVVESLPKRAFTIGTATASIYVAFYIATEVLAKEGSNITNVGLLLAFLVLFPGINLIILRREND